MKKKKRQWCLKRALALFLAGVMIVSQGGSLGAAGTAEVQAAEEETAIEVTSLAYYNAAEATVTASGIDNASFGFVAPLVNGKTYKELNLSQVWSDIAVEAKQADGTWTNVDQSVNPDSIYRWNVDWGFCLGADWDNYVFWFVLDKTTDIRVSSISHPDQYLEYHLVFNQLERQTITSISTTELNQTATATGESAIHFDKLTVNGKVPTLFTEYQQIEDDLEMLVDNKDGKGFVPLSANPDSGFIWDQNFGMWYEGAGGIWFKGVFNSFTVRFQSKSNPSVGCEFNVNYTEPVRANYKLTIDGPGDQIVTSLDANSADNNAASAGIVLPYIGGQSVYQPDLEKFVYEIQTASGDWINLADANSGWVYQGNGYSKYSDKQQWGYFGDYVWGLWFQPVINDLVIRVGYPENGVKGGAINDNYITYTIIGNPDGVIPDVADMVDIAVDNSTEEPTNDNVQDSDISVPEGWEMVWHDEFNGNSLNSNNWANQTGFLLLEDDITTAGWGNNELEWYTDSEKNTSVGDGKLKLTMVPEEKDFYSTDGQKATAKYSSGKILTKDKFSVKYGRIDFRAKLPSGTGIWPAMWMMPNDDIYGTWAASGEIDVFEGKGRVPEMAYGTLHYGNMSPGNKNTGDFINMVENGNVKSDFTNWHVYSLVWEEGNIKMYADGKCYFKCTSETFYSGGAGGNVNAPFDQRFYLIINLAAGGWFDGGTVPADDFEKAEMFVDYVRVYQKQVGEDEDEKPDSEQLEAEGKTRGNISVGKDDNLYGDYHIGTIVPVEKMSLDKTSISIRAGLSEKITATIEPSTATNKNITWTSSAPEVASVTGGTVKGLKPGTATITAVSEDGNITKTCTVEVTGTEVTSVTVTPETLELTVDEQAKIKATVSPAEANQNVIYTSSDTDVVTVDENGYVTAVSAGDATITATAEGTDISASCAVKVNAAPPVLVQGVTIKNGNDESGEVSMEAGSEVTLSATVSPANATNKNVTWTSEDEAVATVNNGKVKAVAEGVTTIKVTTEDGNYTDTWTVIVTKKSAERTDYGIERDGNNVILYCKNVAEVAFSKILSSPDEVIDETKVNGYTTIVQNGEYYEYTIADCVAGNEDKYLACWFNRTNTNKIIMKISDIPVVETEGETPEPKPVESVSITNVPTGSLEIGDTLTLRANVLPYDATDRTVTWTSSATDIAEVDANGKVTAKAAGTATITVTSAADNSKTATCDITVTAAKASYDVNFIVNDETVNSQKVAEGEKVSRPSDPVVKGYTFDGWYVGDAEFDFDSTITTNTDVVAKLSPVQVERILINDITVEVGTKTSITPYILPADALNKNVTWDTDSDFITIDAETGEITAIAEGTAYVTVSATDGSGITGSCEVNVTEKTVNKGLYTVDFVVNGNTVNSQKVTEGEKASKPADPVIEGYTFKGWFADGTEFDFNTPITQRTTIVAKMERINSGDDGNGDESTNVPVSGVIVTPSTLSLKAGASSNLVAAVTPDNATEKAVTWKSSNEAVAKVDATGKVTALAKGTAVITAVSVADNTKTATCTVTVTGSGTGSGNDAGGGTGTQTTKEYTVTFDTAGGSAVDAQKVKAGEKVTKPADPVRDGYAFTGWYNGASLYDFSTAVTGDLTLTAGWDEVKVSKIKITGLSKKIAVTKKIKLTANITPENALNKGVKWTVSNKKYATVSKDGLVKFKKKAKNKTVTVTAEALDGSGVKAKYKIKVMPKAIKKITLKAEKTSVKAGKSVKIKASFSPSSGINKTVEWSVNNKKYATITKKGVLKTKKAGKGKKVKVTAKALDGSGKKKSITIQIK